ncbi:MAG: 3-phosphoserine/phosphohydroxythreonine transaminase [Fimbriimonas ginsengisoli]|uniref:Phosphoserine aminotransferase n=1 Tax=Fimbriimonas ginsengisoli TaxID=1005039 RepID=A0A931PUD9_FIMGI|nr:3-phosphoserine/phosphohydroxythreonine transaminase [Fimbriimonas ginsengisoli]
MSQPYDRTYNFSAGPCTLPVPVLEQARDELLNHQGAGMSVLEMSHRSDPFEAILAQAQADLRALLSIPANYKVLFLQGGASLQFSMIPMCFLRGGTCDHVVTGSWGDRAVESACLEGCVNRIFDAKATRYDRVPDLHSLAYDPNAAYMQFTSNETIQGVQFKGDPSLKQTVICDMSSDILSRPVDVSRYAVVFAGAQKNMGPAGATVVIMREDMFERVPQNMHPMLDYRLQAENDSMYNTPPCFSIYMCGLVYRYTLANGGVAAAQKASREKSDLIYRAIDGSGDFYEGHAQRDCRSTMNVTFRLPSDELTGAFVKEAATLKLDGLKGHRSVGGIRASIYNAFPLEGCQVMADFMGDFAKRKG